MKDTINTRYSQVFSDNEWKDIPPLALKKGMIFRIFEPDGTPTAGENGNLIALGDAEKDENGVIGIQCELMDN